MLLTGLWVLEVHLGSCTPTCYHIQDATDLLGALSSSDSFREPVMKTGKARPTLKHLQHVLSHYEGNTPTILDVELTGF